LEPVADLKGLSPDVLLGCETSANPEWRPRERIESLAERVCEIGIAVEESDKVSEPGLRPGINAALRVAVEKFDEIRSSESSVGIEQIAKCNTVNLGQPLEHLLARLTLAAFPVGHEHATDSEHSRYILL
jgi:hypothetical protein